MATSNANAAIEEIDDAPTIQEFDDSSSGGITEFDDAVVAQAAQNSATVAQQALDVATLPAKMDWSAANEHLDSQRFADILALNEQAGQIEAQDPSQLYNTRGEAAKLRTKAFDLQQQMSDTQAGRDAATMERENRLRSMGTPYAPHETLPTFTGLNGRTPSEALSSFLGPGLSTTAQPVIEGAARNLGGATGGALGAALGAAATAGTGGLFPLAYGIGGAILGSFAGNEAQEKILQTTETPEETQARQQRAANDFAANPGLSKLGAMAAALPFFGPGLAQFGLAAAGDRGAIVNLGLGGTINAATEAGSARFLRHEEVKPEDIAEAFFTGMVLNEPTRLGRKLGLHPSSEQMAREAAQAKYAELAKAEPIGPQDTLPSTPTGEPNAQQVSEASPLNGGVRPPEVPQQNEPLPVSGSSEGVQPSGQGGPLAEAAPEAPREVTSADLPKGEDANVTTWYHGSKYEIQNPSSSFTKHESLFGSGFYLTDDPSIAASYAKTRARGGEGVVNEVRTNVRKVLNFEEPLSKPAAEAILQGVYDDFKPLVEKSISSGKTGAEVWADLAHAVEEHSTDNGNPSSEYAEMFQNIEGNLRDVGYDAITHIGGTRAGKGKKLHRVMILLDPAGELVGVKDGKIVNPRDPIVTTIQAHKKTEAPPALPAEAPPVAQESAPEGTSIKNAVTEQERAARGISPAEEPARQAFGEVWDAVKTEVAENPASPDVLLSELRTKPRALTAREDALLLHRQIDLQKAYDAAAAEVNRAAEAGDEPVRAEAMQRLNGARDALQDIYDIDKRGGTETARGLAARKMIANQDFNLISMETRLRADQGGKLSEPQLEKVKAQAETIARTQAEMDKILAEREAQRAEAEKVEGSLDPKVKSLADRIIARLDIASANAAKSLRSRLSKLNNFVPDPGIVADVAKIAAAKTAKGAIKFAQWSAEMIKDFGEKVRPFLQAGWDQREQHIDAEVGSATAKKSRTTRTDAEKEQSAVKARLTAIANRTASLREKTAKQDFSPLRKAPADLSKNPEWVKLKAENDTAKAEYEKSRYEARKAQRTTEQKVRDTVADVWAASRPMLASTDFSAVGRQGIFFALPDLFTNPVRLARQMRTMFRSQFSESKFQQNEASIKSRENAELYKESDLYLADIDHKPSAREEQFKSELAEKLPGVGRIVRGSSRGFSAFMNTVRADSMDAFVKWSGGRENITPETAKFLAAAINDLSGRGNVTSRQAKGALEWLAKYLFSPRLWVSRFNTATLKPIWRDPLNRGISPRARAVVLGQYVKFTGALLALKWLAGLNGGKMEEDPRDSDFGKLQFGSKRYDVMGGIGNMLTLLARVATQKTKDDHGKLLRIAWSGDQRPEREMGQILFNHIRNKAAPIPGAVYDYFYGRHPDRSKVTPTSMLKQTTVPITVSDTVGYFQKDNPASALRDSLLNAFGVTVQDYRK